MKKFTMIALSNPTAGQEDEFNKWYDEVHLKEICDIPGILAGQRFKLAAGANTWQYLAIYDVESADPAGVVAEIRRRAENKLMVLSSAIDAPNSYLGVFERMSS